MHRLDHLTDTIAFAHIAALVSLFDAGRNRGLSLAVQWGWLNMTKTP